ncbi:penicillin-binding protein 2 [Antribacter sp. KLBMP9083]|uniref:Penicillin-binding protein 2 n=1 Tax=Antribacter soli TaxID=2910976 RepID=A0AA41QBN0_9MICO|nr:penicillin-binding transpeptidase domain-containing protein [Antribacter soli]MCF4120469.1 penicillin-binding protein 2 [Antribacter soli]
MNATLRRLSTVVIAMFMALMVSTTWIQFVRSGEYNENPNNNRKIYAEYGNFRGPIVVGGEAVAASVAVDDRYGYQRVYGSGDATRAQIFAPVTGFYSVTGNISGIENAKDSFLSGSADSLWLDRLQNLITGEEVQGSSVVLTLDPAVQQAAWDALGDQKGAVVAIEPATGKILALVSRPTFDPNVLATHDDTATTNYEALANMKLPTATIDGSAANSPYGPLTNRAIGATFFPGSTFKLVTSAAAIESGQYTPSTQIPAPDTYLLPGTSTEMQNFGGERCSATGQMTLLDALRISCNTAFAQLGTTLGEDALREQAEAFGFNDTLEIPMSTTASSYEADMSPDKVAQTGIGQGGVKATPLQMAMVAAAIANDGVLMEPYLVQQIQDSDLAVIEETSPKRYKTPISPSTAEALTQMMLAVVNDGSGTAAQIPGVAVAGKTGTAEDDPRQPTLWFTAFAPAEAPEVAVAVVLENGGESTNESTGGRRAAPIAQQVIQAVLSR